MKTRAIIQASFEGEGDGKATKNSFKDFQNSLFPFLQKQTQNSDESAIELLKREVSRGPLVVTPQESLVKSRLKKTVDKVKRPKAVTPGSELIDLDDAKKNRGPYYRGKW